MVLVSLGSDSLVLVSLGGDSFNCFNLTACGTNSPNICLRAVSLAKSASKFLSDFSSPLGKASAASAVSLYFLICSLTEALNCGGLSTKGFILTAGALVEVFLLSVVLAFSAAECLSPLILTLVISLLLSCADISDKLFSFNILVATSGVNWIFLLIFPAGSVIFSRVFTDSLSLLAWA